MGLSPIPVLAIIAVYGIIYFALTDLEAEGTENLDTAADIDQPGGILDIIKEVLDSVWGFVQKLVGALTFNVPGAPIYIRTPIAIMIISSLTWSIVTLIRGN